MEIIEQIGSYAGLAAVLGLAVLAALYFSQARDVRRLREWAGRAPERTGEPATAQPQRVVGRPVPQPPGQGTQAPAKPAQAPAVAGGAAAGAAAASAAGAAPPFENAAAASLSSTLEAATFTSSPAAWRMTRTSLLEIPRSLAIW